MATSEGGTTAEGIEQRRGGRIYQVAFAGVYVVRQGRRRTCPTADTEGRVPTFVPVREDW
jgi:hypothetical protein